MKYVVSVELNVKDRERAALIASAATVFLVKSGLLVEGEFKGISLDG